MASSAPGPHRVRPILVAACLAAIAVALCVAGCGKKGSPQPPIRRQPERIGRLEARQVGDRIYLSFPRPRGRTDDSRLGSDATIEVVMSTRDPAPRRAGEIVADPTAAWMVPGADWDAYAQGDRLEVGIRLQRIAAAVGAAGPLVGRRLSFAVVVTEPRNRRSEASDIATVEVCSPPPAPTQCLARIAEDGVLLTWAPGEDGNARFNVYRSERGGPRPARPMHPAPLAAPSYLDETAAEGRPYVYFVRAAGGGCESSGSEPAPATRIDLFPPSPPQGLAAVAERGTIRLFWRPSREADLKGYRVYRADGPGSPWRRLTAEHIAETSHTDADVVAGVPYVYAVTAVDLADPPNESRFSDVTMETMEPPR